MKRILGIFRAACFSPGMIERDEAILRAVAKRLEEAHYAVNLIHEEEFNTSVPIPDIVLHMARSPYALSILEDWQESGCHVLNPIESVRNVERENLALYCAKLEIPTPDTWIVDTANIHPGEITFPCWVKRTGACTQQPDDICYIPDIDAYRSCISRFHTRNINKAVVMGHLEGVNIKFYGIQGTDFFHHLPAGKLGYTKWPSFSLPSNWNRNLDSEMTSAMSQIRSLLNELKTPDNNWPFPIIYGGDAIIGSDGIARIIDLNDWPSFSVCREEAADAIAYGVMENRFL